MTPDVIAIVSVGAALGALMLALWRNLSARMDRLDARIDRLEDRIERLDGRVADLDRRLARIEGVIEGMAYANGRPRERPAA